MANGEAGNVEKVGERGDKGVWAWVKAHLLKPSLIWLLVAGLLLILFNVLVEVALHAGEAGPDAHGEEHSTSISLMQVNVLAGLAREIGFAFMISFIIATLIEQDSKRRQEEQVNNFIKRTSNDVFETVLGSFLPERFRQAFLSIGRTAVVRTDMIIRYEVSELEPSELRGLDNELKDFVKLHIFSEYRLKNISATDYVHQIKNSYPIRSENQFYVDLSRITRLRLGRADLDAAEIEKLTGEPDEDHPDYRTFSKKYTIKPDEEIIVAVENVLVKERSDNEVWVSLIPTDQLRMICNVRLKGETEFGVTAYCPSGMEERMSAGGPATAGVWASGGPILPYQSVVFWWREKLPEAINQRWIAADPGAAQASQGAAK